MRTEENNLPLVIVGLLLTAGILIAFQIYVLGEPGRIDRVLAQDHQQAFQAGQQLFQANCVVCHGQNGEGNIGPALNNPTLLGVASDDTLFSVISSGVPNTAMPAWNQSHGGPFTDDQVRQLVVFIRAWQTSTPQATPATPAATKPAVAQAGNASHGSAVFQQRCAACHGDNGEGLVGPALNDQAKLAQFDDNWYRQTITDGRPSKGMPTWGTVLSPQDINDVVAFIRQWATAPAGTPSPVGTATEIARPSNPGGPGEAITLTGDAVAGAQVFTTNCAVCHGQQGAGGVPNPGSDDGTVPSLNPIDPTLISANAKSYAANLDLFIEHGSTPSGPSPARSMPAWGDQKKLTPQQIADVIAYLMTLNPPPEVTPTATEAATPEVARPSNPGGPGAAVSLTGDTASGDKVFTTNCAVCHGQQGAGGVPNPGSDDGTVPPLNPVDPTLIDADLKTYATNLDLFIEHGSTPSGPSPAKSMPAWGDQKKLTPQQIADVIAYLISLNPVAAKPSNPGGPGAAVSLTGDAASGEKVFATNCAVCHGQQGAGGAPNPGSDDGTVPPLNPIDPTLINKDPATYATNLDLFIEHGSTPSGPSPAKSMPAWGDQKKLTPQQIADVIAYLISLNPAK